MKGESILSIIKHKVEFCVVGGGLAGMCAAITAARHGVKTLLMQDRPVLGGNASSEIRMWVCGAHGNLETGLIEEIRLENLYRNNYPNFSIWDSILYEKVKFQKNLTVLLNCSCNDAEMDGTHIKSIKGWQLTTQDWHEVEADIFADCSGDSVLAPLTGAEFRMGREARAEFKESIAPVQADRRTMGMSCLIQARETNQPQKFIPPAWANKYPDEESLAHRSHRFFPNNNFWWLELGGENDSIKDTEELRDELLKIAFGLWDHIKNYGDHGAENWVLEWVGFLPGKRESRRYVGDHIMTQNDVSAAGKFKDIIAYGGWSMDDHHPAGFDYRGVPTIFHPAPSPFGIPYRCLYSVNIDNLMFAGRNISATHSAMSSTRVMATCALLGQAVGTGAMLAVKKGILPRGVSQKWVPELQQALMDDDCWLPGLRRSVSKISAESIVVASQGDAEVLRNGDERELGDDDNSWIAGEGDWAEYQLSRETELQEIRLVFDSNLVYRGMNNRNLNMVCNFPLDMPKYQTPETIVRGFHIEAEDADGKVSTIYCAENNYQRLVRITKPFTAKRVRLVIDAVRGKSGTNKIFAFDVK